jgi:hypothetical protein
MDRLNSLREQYVQQMSSRLKSKSMDEDTLLQARTQKEFQFLERNLEELDRAHKKVSFGVGSWELGGGSGSWEGKTW